MTFQIETIIYIYLFVSVCVILFNIFCLFSRKISEKLEMKHRILYEEKIQEHFDELEVDVTHEAYFMKQLQSVSRLIAFHQAITNLRVEQEEKVCNYLKRYEKVFLYLVQIYMQRPSVYQAYFAYLMSVYPICNRNSKNYITESMLELTKSSSLYVRENAMKALISFGQEQNVLQGLKNIDRFGYEYHPKMLTDDLLLFPSNSERLISLLISSFSSFSEAIQLGIIHYVTYQSGEYCEFFYQTLEETVDQKELQLAILRYFARYPYDPIVPILYQYLDSFDSNYWEYAAVASYVLQYYPTSKTKQKLLRALSHENWYVRKNAASSLMQMNLTDVDVLNVMNGKDRYAKEALVYELEKREL